MRILFVCEANSTRSQLAAGIAQARWVKQDINIESCGNFDGGGVNPYVKKVLLERGIDYAEFYSKSYRSIEHPETIDYVIILCGRDFIGNYFSNAKKFNVPLGIPGIGFSLTNQHVLNGYQQLALSIDQLLEELEPEILGEK